MRSFLLSDIEVHLCIAVQVDNLFAQCHLVRLVGIIRLPAPVQHPFVAISFDTQLDIGGITGGDLWLSHGVGGSNLAH